MTKGLVFRPSGIQRVLQCPGSAQAEAPFPRDPDNDYTVRGRRLHDAMALAFRIGLAPALAKITPQWTEMYERKAMGCIQTVEKDIEAVKQAHAAAKLIIPEGAKLAPEFALELDEWGLSGGRPDLMVFDEKTKSGIVIDWKFGSGSVEDPEGNGQLWIYGRALSRMKPELESVSLAIIQPGAWKVDDAVRETIFPKEVLDEKIKIVQKAIADAKLPDAPRFAGDQCRYCKAKNTCEVYAAGAVEKSEAKAAKKAEELAVVTDGTPLEVHFTPPLPDMVVVISKELMTRAEDLLAQVDAIQVVDQGTANTLGQVRQNASKLINAIEENRKAVKAPYLDACRTIDEAPKEVLDKLGTAVSKSKNKVTVWMRDEDEKAAKAKAEQERLHREAEEKIRLAKEAAEAAAKATKDAEDAARNAQTASKPTADAFGGPPVLTPPPALQAQADAELAQQKAVEANKAAHEALMKSGAAPAAPAEPAKVTGFRQVEVVTYTIPDLSKVPADWARQILMPDDKVIKALLKGKKLNEEICGDWMKIERKMEAQGSR